jgi:two-component system response regulator FlrC
MHRILIVEDNPVDQRLFEQALSDPTHEIEVCSDGRAALAAFERCAADVVISDVVMPNMEGNELLTELHRRIPGLLIILVTRFGSISAAVAAMQAGAFDLRHQAGGGVRATDPGEAGARTRSAPSRK